MGRRKPLERKEEPGHARQDRERQENGGPAVETLSRQESVDHHESRADADQADDDVHDGENQQTGTHDHSSSLVISLYAGPGVPCIGIR